MCLLERTYDNQEKFHNDQDFRRAVAYEAGHVREFMTMEGEMLRYPLPYDYEHLPDEDDFTKAFGAAMTVCAAIVRLTAPDLEEEIARDAQSTVYKARHPIFEAVKSSLAQGTESGNAAVHVKGIMESQAPAAARYEPGNPSADDTFAESPAALRDTDRRVSPARTSFSSRSEKMC